MELSKYSSLNNVLGIAMCNISDHQESSALGSHLETKDPALHAFAGPRIEINNLFGEELGNILAYAKHTISVLFKSCSIRTATLDNMYMNGHGWVAIKLFTNTG